MITTFRCSWEQEKERCSTIRRIVFVQGQNVPEEAELDGLDSDAQHYLVLNDGKSIATARVRFLKDYAKIERVAVLPDYQGQSIGRRLMEFILEDVKKDSPAKKAKLGSQNHAIPFYAKLGFQVIGEEYMDCDIPHHEMMFDFSKPKSP